MGATTLIADPSQDSNFSGNGGDFSSPSPQTPKINAADFLDGKTSTASSNGNIKIDAADFLDGKVSAGTIAGVDALNARRQSQTGPVPLASPGSDLRFQQENAIDGVPLDASTGESAWVRAQLAARRDRSNQIKVLQAAHPGAMIREATDGDLIVRVPDGDTGQMKDLKVNERGLSMKDFLDLAPIVPQVAMGMLVSRGLTSIPWLGKLGGIAGWLRNTGGAIAGGEATGAAQDVTANLIDRGKSTWEDNKDILQSRFKSAAGDTAASLLLAPAELLFHAPPYLVNLNRGAVHEEANLAQKALSERGFPEITKSLGEATGNPIAGRVESYLEQMPGASGTFSDLKGKQEGQIRELQTMLMTGVDPKTTPPLIPGASTDEALGQQAMDALRAKSVPIAQGVESAAKDLGTTSAKDIQQTVANAVGYAPELESTKIGDLIRSQVQALRDKSDSEVSPLYDKLREEFGGREKNIPTGDLSKDAQKILDELPTSVTKKEGVGYDAYGSPVISETTSSQPLSGFVPNESRLMTKLKDMVALKGQKMSWSELQQMRTEVYDMMQKGEALPDIGVHYLSQIGKSLTKAIEDHANSLPASDPFKAALTAANDAYKTKMLPFDLKGVSEIFRKPTESSFIDNAALANRLTNGRSSIGNYLTLRDTMGAQSPEFQRVNRFIADTVLEDSKYPGSQTFDAKRLISNLSTFQREAREVSGSVFGPNLEKLINQAKALKISEGDKLDSGDLMKLLQSGDVSNSKVMAMIRAQKSKDALYQNGIMKAVSEGDFSSEMIKPTDFVNRFLDDAQPSEVRQVFGLLHGDPQLVQDIRQKSVEKFLRDVGRAPKAGDLNDLITQSGTYITDTRKAFAKLREGNFRDNMETVLGPQTFKDLMDYLKVIAPIGEKEAAFKGAGMLGNNMQIGEMLRGGHLTYLEKAAKYFIDANVVVSAPLRKWLSMVPENMPKTQLALSLLTNPILLKNAIAEFGSDGAKAFTLQAVDSIKKTEAQQNSTPNKINAVDFLGAGPTNKIAQPAK